MPKSLLFILLFDLAVLGVSCAQQPQTIKLTQLETAPLVESTRAGQVGLSNADGKQRYAQYVEIEPNPISYTPTPTGNTANLSEFVTTPTGDLYYIDWQGRAVLLEIAPVEDKNGYYGGNGGNGGDGTVPSATTSTLTNQLTFEVETSAPGGMVPVRINVADSSDFCDWMSMRSGPDSLLFRIADDNIIIEASQFTDLSMRAGGKVYLDGDSCFVSGVPTAPAGERTFAKLSTTGGIQKAEGISWNDLTTAVKDTVLGGYNTAFTSGGALGNVDITDGGGTLSVPVLDIAPVQSLTSANGTIQITNSPGGANLLDLAQQGATVGQGLLWNGTKYAPGAVGTGDILQNGNSFGAGVVIGSNDNNSVSFETNGVTRLTTSSSGTTGGDLTATGISANTTTVQDRLTIQTNSTGTPGTGFGGGILFQGESSTTDNRDMARISSLWTVPTDASRSSAIVFSGVNSGAALAEFARFDLSANPVLYIASVAGTTGTSQYRNNGITTGTSYTVGNSSSALTLGGSSGTVTVQSNSSTANAITLSAAQSAGGIQLGTNTAGNSARNALWHPTGFNPTGGTQTYTSFLFDGTFNQAGGAIGTTRAMYLNQTLTNVTDFRGIEIAYSNANAKGIYQTGPLTTNNLVGPTNIGSTNAPVALTPLTLEYASANTSTVQDMSVIRVNSTGAPSIGFGPGLLFQGESSTTDNRDMARITANWTGVTDASREAAISFQVGDNGGALAEVVKISSVNAATGQIDIGNTTPLRLQNNAITGATSLTVGAGSNQVTVGGSSGAAVLGGSSGLAQVTTSSTSSNAIVLLANDNAASSQAGVDVGNGTSFTQTSGTRNYFKVSAGFAPTSGTAVHNSFVLTGTIDQNGGAATGITRGVYDNHNLVNVTDYRAFETSVNNASAKGFYQSGANTKNTLVGATGFGSTTVPTDKVEVTGNLALLTPGNKLKIATGTDASVGTGTFVAGTATINTTAVTANSLIFIQVATAGGTQGHTSYTTVPGTSFTVNSTSATETSTFNWFIIN